MATTMSPPASGIIFSVLDVAGSTELECFDCLVGVCIICGLRLHSAFHINHCYQYDEQQQKYKSAGIDELFLFL